MYGFLRPDHCLLSPEDRKDYYRYYCGQCGALQQAWGYPWRALVSHDAAFLGLLLSAQLMEDPKEGKAWCAVFPRRIGVCEASYLPQVFSSALSVILFSMKLADARQEKESKIKSIIAGVCNKGFAEARNKLAAMDFPLALVEETLTAQQWIEGFSGQAMEKYAEPSARFLGEVFRFTARAAKQPQNESLLYEIGFHAGRLIYLADSCVDILDDMEKKEFNALMAAYAADQKTISPLVRGQVTDLAMESIAKIQAMTEKLSVTRYFGLLANVLLQGLPRMIHLRIEQSAQKLAKERPLLLKYLPHAALASALCTAFSQDAVAGWISMGRELDRDAYACGISCGDVYDQIRNKKSNLDQTCAIFNVFCNPLYWLLPRCGGHNTDGCGQICIVVCQGPKAYASFLAGGMIKRKMAENEALRRKKQEEEQRRAEAERIRKNNDYIQRATAELDSLENYFKTGPLGFAGQIVPSDFRSSVNIFLAASHQSENLTSNAELQKLIETKTGQLRHVKAQFENSQSIKRQATEKCREIKSRFDRSMSAALPLYKELVWAYEQLDSEHLNSLIRQQQWERYREAIQRLMDDMDRLQEQARNYQPPRHEAYKQNVSTLDHLAAKRLLLLLNACTDQRLCLIEMAMEDIARTEAFQFGLHIDEYDFLTSRTKKLRDEINRKELEYVNKRDTAQLTLGRIIDLYRKLKELLAMKERSENTLADGKTDDIDIIHHDWRNYLAKLQGRFI